MLILAIIFFALTIENSIGNVTEILNLLDKDKYSGEQIIENYTYLVNKWGEWEIIGGAGGLSIRYVDVGNALFSGLMITYTCLTAASLCIALLLGKLIFPLLAKMYKNANEELVDMATLTSASKIEEMHAASKKSKSEGGWF